jgi:hypothetical protein
MLSHYVTKSLIEKVTEEHRLKRLGSNHSWNDRLAQIDSVEKASDLTITCIFESASKIPKARTQLPARLESFNSSGKSTSVNLDCDESLLESIFR